MPLSYPRVTLSVECVQINVTDRQAATAARIHLDVLGVGHLDVLDEILTHDYVGHLLPKGTAPGPAGLKALARDVRAAFPDLSYSIEHCVSQDDLVALRVSGQGTQAAAFRGSEVSGRSARWSEMHVLRFVGDRIAEHWAVVDQLSALQQLGAVRLDLPRVVVDRSVTVEIPEQTYALLDDYCAYGCS